MPVNTPVRTSEENYRKFTPELIWLWLLQGLSILLLLGLFMLPGKAQAQVVDLKDLLNPDNQIQQIDPNIQIIPKGVICFAPFIQNQSKTACVCPIGKKKFGNTCKSVFCISPKKHNANGDCVCPVGMKPSGNSCVPHLIQILCKSPFVQNFSKNACVCPIGMKQQGNTCVDIPKQISCFFPFVSNAAKTKCVCPAGQKKQGNTCVPIPNLILCNQPFIPNATGTDCICPPGTQPLGNTCGIVPAAPQCSYPFVYSSNRNACVCAKGYKLSASGASCIRKQSAPATPKVPRSVVAEIQNCLGRLGYDAGPADGAIGNRTRSAWSSFRIDENLRSRPNTLADDVTQDRLFQSCAALDVKPADPAPVDPVPVDPAPQTPGTPLPPQSNYDPETGYPPIQCITPGLKGVFKLKAGEDEEIGICGEVCVPIPDGMTSEQIVATSTNINWCMNCTKIGETEMICAAPNEKEAGE